MHKNNPTQIKQNGNVVNFSIINYTDRAYRVMWEEFKDDKYVRTTEGYITPDDLIEFYKHAYNVVSKKENLDHVVSFLEDYVFENFGDIVVRLKESKELN